MSLVRPAAVADSFYQGSKVALQADIRAFIDRAENEHYSASPSYRTPKALIAPHAGHRYSGYCATRAYLTIAATMRERIRRIILLGPAHFFAARGMALTRADWWECPLGAMEIDREAGAQALAFAQVESNDIPHMREHSLEVHVPFLKYFFPHAKLLPFAVSDIAAAEVAEVLEALWGGHETLIVISTDLSHYNDYEEAMRLDSETAHWIESYDWAAIDGRHACGRVPMAGLLAGAKARDMSIERVYMMNSGDALADKRAQVVGYGAWALH